MMAGVAGGSVAQKSRGSVSEEAGPNLESPLGVTLSASLPDPSYCGSP
jgi:hypothetical protein